MLKFDGEKFTKQLREDVRQLILKGITGLSEPDYRVLAWKTAALESPPTAGDANVSPMRDTRIGFWRSELLKKLRKLEALEKASMISRVPCQQEEKALLEAECDELAQLILDAEEEQAPPMLPSGKGARLESVVKLEAEQGIFDGGRMTATRSEEERKRIEKLRRPELTR